MALLAGCGGGVDSRGCRGRGGIGGQLLVARGTHHNQNVSGYGRSDSHHGLWNPIVTTLAAVEVGAVVAFPLKKRGAGLNQQRAGVK